MENIMEQIRTRLQNGETPRSLVKEGFKRATVYSVADKMKTKIAASNDEKSVDRDIFLALLTKNCLGVELIPYDENEDDMQWKGMIELASDEFEELLGRKPPNEFMTTLFPSTK